MDASVRTTGGCTGTRKPGTPVDPGVYAVPEAAWGANQELPGWCCILRRSGPDHACTRPHTRTHAHAHGHPGSVTKRHPRKGASQACPITNRCQRVAPTAKVDHWSPKSRNRSQDAASPSLYNGYHTLYVGVAPFG